MMSDQNDIDVQSGSWQAFRFLADELSDLDAVAFEAQLLNDEDASEALVAACSLTESIFQAFASASGSVCGSASDRESEEQSEIARVSDKAIQPPVATARRRTSVWFSQAACLVAMVGVGVGLWLTRGGIDAKPQISVAQASELVRGWGSAGDVVPAAEFAALDLGQGVGTSSDIDSDSVVDEVRGDDIPDWLLAALQSQRDRGEAGTDEVMDN